MQTTSGLLCHHCGNEVLNNPIYNIIDGDKFTFCCQGCLTVSEIIHLTGKEKYYSLRGSTTLDPVNIDHFNGENLDTPQIYEKYLSIIDNTYSEIFIKVTNIHCSACVWLNEKALEEANGVNKAIINFATGTARVIFDKNKISITEIFSIIRSIGYKPILFKPGEKLTKGQNNLKSLLLKIGVAAFCFGNIMLFSVSLYSGYFEGIDITYKRLLHYVSWALATPAYLYSGSPFMKGAGGSLKRKTLTMDLLLFLGISLAYFYSVFVTISDRGEVYFDSVCMIYFFILIGKYFEEKSRVNSHEKIDELLSKLPEMSTCSINNIDSVIPSESIQKGMILKAITGERIPVDCILLSEKVHLDESFLTGESRPVPHSRGDLLQAGSICLDSSVLLEAYSSYSESSLSRMKNRIEEAILSKPKIQILTERIAGRFIKIVFLIAISTFMGWYFFSNDLEKAIIYTISVLIVACPCALGISVPTALVTNHIVNSKFGAILKSPNAIEPLSKIDTILFDKTGTLTEGKFRVIKSTIIDNSILDYIYAIEKENRHPLARSIQKYIEENFTLKNEKIQNIELKNLKVIAGEGITTEIYFNGKNNLFLIGNKTFLNNHQIQIPDVKEEGSIVYTGINHSFTGYLLLSDSIRPESLELIQRLKKSIPDIRIISGDRNEAVISVSKTLGIPSYHSDCKPETKAEIVSELHSQGKIVAMVGDGINDSLSLAGADVGISHSEAEDLSIDKSDLIIASGNLLSIYKAILSAKTTERVIKENIFISLCYNSIMLPLAVFGYMLPVICAGFMTLSSLTVLINSLSIRWRSKN